MSRLEQKTVPNKILMFHLGTEKPDSIALPCWVIHYNMPEKLVENELIKYKTGNLRSRGTSMALMRL